MKRIGLVIYAFLLLNWAAGLNADIHTDMKEFVDRAITELFGSFYNEFKPQNMGNQQKITQLQQTMNAFKLLVKKSSSYLGKEDPILNKAANDAATLSERIVALGKIFAQGKKENDQLVSADRKLVHGFATDVHNAIRRARVALQNEPFYLEDKKKAKKLIDDVLDYLEQVALGAYSKSRAP